MWRRCLGATGSAAGGATSACTSGAAALRATPPDGLDTIRAARPRSPRAIILTTRDGTEARYWIDTPVRDVALHMAWEAYMQRHASPPIAARSFGDEVITSWIPDLNARR